MIALLQQPCTRATFTVGNCGLISHRVYRSALQPLIQQREAHHCPGHTGQLFISSRRGLQTRPQAGRDTLLRGVPGEYIDDVARVVEQAERAADTTWTTIHTGETLYTLSRAL